MKQIISLLVAISLAGCMSAQEREARNLERAERIKALTEACSEKGGTAYWHRDYRHRFEFCLMPEEKERSDLLELECIKAGGTVDYKRYWGKTLFSNCRHTPMQINNSTSVRVSSNASANSTTDFKPYCHERYKALTAGC